MKRQKIELTPSLKAEDYLPDTTVIATGSIKDIQAVKTKFDDDSTTSTIVYIEDNADGKVKGVFANVTSINNLIDAFGEEDNIWKGKIIRVICNKNNSYNKKQLVIEAIK